MANKAKDDQLSAGETKAIGAPGSWKPQVDELYEIFVNDNKTLLNTRFADMIGIFKNVAGMPHQNEAGHLHQVKQMVDIAGLGMMYKKCVLILCGTMCVEFWKQFSYRCVEWRFQHLCTWLAAHTLPLVKAQDTGIRFNDLHHFMHELHRVIAMNVDPYGQFAEKYPRTTPLLPVGWPIKNVPFLPAIPAPAAAK